MYIVSKSFHQLASPTTNTVNLTICRPVAVLPAAGHRMQLFAVNSAGQRGVGAVQGLMLKRLVHVVDAVGLRPVAVTLIVDVDR